MKTRRLILIVFVVLTTSAVTFAQRTDKRDMRRAVKYLEEDPHYLKKLPKVIWRRPMGPFVKDLRANYHDGPGPARMVVKRSGNHLKVLGANFLLVWDDRRGGEISEIFLFDGSTWKHVSCTMAYEGRDTIPRYRIQRKKDFHGKSPVYYLNQAIDTTFNITRNDADRVDFSTENRMVTVNRAPGPWTVRQKFRVYPQGVVVCDFEIELDEAAGSFALRHAQIGAYLEDILFKEIYVVYPVHFQWGTTEYGGRFRYEPNWKKLSEDRLVPVGSATFGVSRRGGKTNRFEFWLERPRPFVGKRAATTATRFEVFSSGLWYEPSDMSTRPSCGRRFVWELHRGDPVEVKTPFTYRNRWVLALGGPKVGGPTAGAARRNNLLAKKIVHWPAVDGQVQDVAASGAEVLVLGRGWSKADAPLEAADRDRFSTVVKKAHASGMRVVLAVPLSAAKAAGSLFRGVLAANRDGLLVYGLGPMTMKPDVDLAGRVETLAALRKLVGSAGILMGRAPRELPSQAELAFLDAVVVPPEQTDRFPPGVAAVGCAVSPLVKPGISRQAAAHIAAVPAAPQLMFAPGVKNTSLAGLWKLWSRLDGPVLHALSPVLENNPKLTVEPKEIPVVAYLTKTKLLLVVANPRAARECRITLASALGVKPDAAGTLITIADGELVEAPFRLRNGKIEIPEVKRGEIRAYEFPRLAPAPQ